MSNDQPQTGEGRGFKILYILTLAALVFSGFGQMPIFKRYYLADLPGMAWTADFFTTLIIHYIAASVFLALVVYVLVSRAMQGGLMPINGPAWVRAFLFLVMILTGSLLVARNAPGLVLPPGLIVAATLTHVIGTMLFLISAATYFRLAKK